MKNLVLTVAVLGAMTVATGCTTLGNVTASWDLQEYDEATGNIIHNAGCPTGADTAIVYALPAGDQNLNDADKDLFNCSDGIGTTAGHIAGSYQVWVAITDHSGAQLFAQSDYDTISISDGTNTSESFGFQVNRGDISAAWTLADKNGTPTTCSAAAVPAVEFESMVGTDLPFSDTFDCTANMGTTNPLSVNTYLFGLAAVDSSKPPKALGPESTPKTEDIQWGNQHLNAGTIVVQAGF